MQKVLTIMHKMRSLITITTCKRLDEVKKHVWQYIQYCNQTEGISFLLALDGTDDSYLEFCNHYHIPLLYSDQREGVGVSKNRVLQCFPDFDYYFFIDDDVELLDSSIFVDFIEIYESTKIPHLSVNTLRELTGTISVGNHILTLGNYGGAYFNFFSKSGLDAVGGWNTLFAKYKRYGHTEHSYRFYHKNLTPAPFVAVTSSNGKVLLYNPPHVSTESDRINNTSQLIPEEEELIKAKSTYFPLKTISQFHFNGFESGYNKTIEEFLLNNKKKYPLTKGKERRILFAEYYFEMYKREKGLFKRGTDFLRSVFNYPFSNSLKHHIKTKLGF